MFISQLALICSLRLAYFVTDEHKIDSIMLIRQYVETLLVSSFQVHNATYTEVAVYIVKG